MKKKFITRGVSAILGAATLMVAANGASDATAQTNAALNLVVQINGSGTVTPNVAAKNFVLGNNYTLTATPAAGWLLSNWTIGGVVVSTVPAYTISAVPNLVLQANFGVNPFPPAAGAYHGLYYVPNNAAPQSSGAFSATVNNKGAFTAQLRTAAKSYPFSGQFALDGTTSRTFPRSGLSPLTTQLQLNWSNSLITGTVSDGTWTADLVAYLAPYSSTNPAPQAGRYTLLIPGGNAPSQPAGNSIGSVVIASSGAVSFSGFLGDGTSVNYSTAMAGNGTWPFYVPLYGGQGSVLGWVGFDTNKNLTGQTGWFKLPVSGAKFYPGGFTNSAPAIGSIYHYTNGAPLLGFTQGQILLTNGGLSEGITNDVVFEPGALPTASGRVTFKTSAGMFTYTTPNPETGKTIAVNGIVLQNQNLGGGYFLGASQSGSAVLAQTGPWTNLLQNFGTNSGTNSVTNNNLPSNGVSSTTIFGLLNSVGPFAIYDQQFYPGAGQVRLGYWKFDSATMTNTAGLMPLFKQNLGWVSSWSGHAASFPVASQSTLLTYPVVSQNTNYFDPLNGTVRFWYQPNWSNGSENEPTYRFGQVFMSTADANGGWVFGLLPIDNDTPPTNYVIVLSVSQNNGYQQGYTFDVNGAPGAPIQFQSNLWYQIALAYSPSNVALYTNGVLLATGSAAPMNSNNVLDFTMGCGVLDISPLGSFTSGFSIGNEPSQFSSVQGQITDVETFNYPLTAQQIGAGFPTFDGFSAADVMSDSNYLGRSDLLQQLVDGNTTNAHCQLGYWRFDTPQMYSEQGQMPLSSNNVTLAPSWSGTALDIGRDPASELTYWDVFTNGWANFNCREGTLSFWFKPNNPNGPHEHAPFVYMGSPDGMDMWDLSWDPAGNTICFTTGSNWVRTAHFTANCSFSTTHWTQIVVTYGSNSSSLYLNGVLAASGQGIKYWPRLSNRNLGMVIGNTTAYNNSINGQFDEIQTYNYELDPATIRRHFQQIQAIDSDLNGVPDLLEDASLSNARPFLGVPTAITGTVEAEQFDLGGNGIGYYTVNSHPTNSYRPTGLYITNCDDVGEGYCLDQTVAGEWAQYTINVLAGQTYTVETRAEGIETNGVFECEFTNAAGFYTNTGPLTITTTNWTNISAVVYLPTGTNFMRLHFLTNGSDGAHVGRFNYISLFPYWFHAGPGTNEIDIPSSSLSTGTNWSDGTNNAVVIQSAIDSLPATGGTVVLPSGTYYLAQVHPNDFGNSGQNDALYVINNNVAIAGSNTSLVAFNRSTVLFSLGANVAGLSAAWRNVTLRDLTLIAQPHLVSFPDSALGYTNLYELGQLLNSAIALVALNTSNTAYSSDCVISNCTFLHADRSIAVSSYATNCLITACTFLPWDATNYFTGLLNQAPSNTAPTSPNGGERVGIFGSTFNLNIIGNTYIGNSDPTNDNGYFGPDGFIYMQSAGNVFIARNTISNYGFEGIIVCAGPNDLVGNSFSSTINNQSSVVLSLPAVDPGLTGTPADYFTCFIGNSVNGGFQGLFDPKPTFPYSLNCSGNYFSLFPSPQQSQIGMPSGVVQVEGRCLLAAVCGNTFASGGYGFEFSGTNGLALILGNDFTGVNWCPIGPRLVPGPCSVDSVAVFNNILGQGATYNIQLPLCDSFGWFVSQNTCLDTHGNVVPVPFMDPMTSEAHLWP